MAAVFFYYEKGDTNFQLWPHKPVSHIMMELDWDFDKTEIIFHTLFHANVREEKGFGAHVHLLAAHPGEARPSSIFPEEGGSICVT